MLRCDAANGWVAGTTARFISTHRYGLRPGMAPALGVVATDLDLSRLAMVLALSADDLNRMTFWPALARLYPLMAPRAHLLGPVPRFRVCPWCVANDALLPRWLALPLLRSCPRHEVLFQDTCRCGVRLEPFHRRGNPFACAQCGTPWSALPAIYTDDTDRAVDVATTALYALLLDGGTRTMVADALYLVRRSLAERGWQAFPVRQMRGVRLPERTDGMLALASVVAGLLVLELTPQHLAALQPSGSRSSVRCTDQVCPVFNADQAHNMRVRQHGRCYGVYESYCTACGSAFLDTHLALICAAGATVSRAHAYPLAPSVARRQGHLSVWRLRLEYVCAEMLVAGEPLVLQVALRRAQIPSSVKRRVAWTTLARVADDYAALRMKAIMPSFRVQDAMLSHETPAVVLMPPEDGDARPLASAVDMGNVSTPSCKRFLHEGVDTAVLISGGVSTSSR